MALFKNGRRYGAGGGRSLTLGLVGARFARRIYTTREISFSLSRLLAGVSTRESSISIILDIKIQSITTFDTWER